MSKPLVSNKASGPQASCATRTTQLGAHPGAPSTMESTSESKASCALRTTQPKTPPLPDGTNHQPSGPQASCAERTTQLGSHPGAPSTMESTSESRANALCTTQLETHPLPDGTNHQLSEAYAHPEPPFHSAPVEDGTIFAAGVDSSASATPALPSGTGTPEPLTGILNTSHPEGSLQELMLLGEISATPAPLSRTSTSNSERFPFTRLGDHFQERMSNLHEPSLKTLGSCQCVSTDSARLVMNTLRREDNCAESIKHSETPIALPLEMSTLEAEAVCAQLIQPLVASRLEMSTLESHAVYAQPSQHETSIAISLWRTPKPRATLICPPAPEKSAEGTRHTAGVLPGLFPLGEEYDEHFLRLAYQSDSANSACLVMETFQSSAQSEFPSDRHSSTLEDDDLCVQLFGEPKTIYPAYISLSTPERTTKLELPAVLSIKSTSESNPARHGGGGGNTAGRSSTAFARQSGGSGGSTAPVRQSGSGSYSTGAGSNAAPDRKSASASGSTAAPKSAGGSGSAVARKSGGGGAAPARKSGGGGGRVAPHAPKAAGVSVCLCCARVSYDMKRALQKPCGPAPPTLADIQAYVEEYGSEEATKHFGINYDKKRKCEQDSDSRPEDVLVIDPIGHKHLKTSVIGRNDVSVNGSGLLDKGYPADKWLLLTSLPGGTALNKSGEVIPAATMKAIFDLIRNGRKHQQVQLLRSIEQVKDYLDGEDIERCANPGCVFHFSAEGVVRTFNMCGLPFSIESMTEAFYLQLYLLEVRLRNEQTAKRGQQALAELIEGTIDIAGFLETLVVELFEICNQENVTRRALGSSCLDDLVSSVNNWIRLTNPSHTDLIDIAQACKAIVANRGHAASAFSWVKRISNNVLLVAHSDKLAGIQDLALKKRLETIAQEVIDIKHKLKQFLVNGDDAFRRTCAATFDSVTRFSRATDQLGLKTSLWAQTVRENSSAALLAGPFESSELDEQPNALALISGHDNPAIKQALGRAFTINPELASLVQNASNSGAFADASTILVLQLAQVSGSALAISVPETRAALYVLCQEDREVRVQLSPTPFESLTPIPLNATATLFVEAYAGADARDNLAQLEQARQETLAWGNEGVDSNQTLQCFAQAQANCEYTVKEMHKAIVRYLNKIFGLLYAQNREPQAEEKFRACMCLFDHLAPDAIKEIIRKWDGATAKERRSCQVGKDILQPNFARNILEPEFKAALSNCTVTARKLYQMKGKIESILTKMRKSQATGGEALPSQLEPASTPLSRPLPMPTESQINDAFTESGGKPVEFLVSTCKLDFKERAKKWQGFSFTHRDQGDGTHRLVFHSGQDVIAQALQSEAAARVANVYVAFNVRDISQDGTFCETLNGRKIQITATGVSIANRNTNTNKKNSYSRKGSGCTEVPVQQLSKIVKERSGLGDKDVLPLVGLVEHGKICKILTGSSNPEKKELKKFLHEEHRFDTSEIPTVFDVSKERKSKKSYKDNQRGDLDDDLDGDLDGGLNGLADSFALLATGPGHIAAPSLHETSRLLLAAYEKRSNLDEYEEAHAAWLKNYLAKPLCKKEAKKKREEAKKKEEILRALHDLPPMADDEPLKQFIQIVANELGEWTDPWLRQEIDITIAVANGILEMIEPYLTFAFGKKKSPGVLLEIHAAINNWFYCQGVPVIEEDEDEDEDEDEPEPKSQGGGGGKTTEQMKKEARKKKAFEQKTYEHSSKGGRGGSH